MSSVVVVVVEVVERPRVYLRADNFDCGFEYCRIRANRSLRHS